MCCIRQEKAKGIGENMLHVDHKLAVHVNHLSPAVLTPVVGHNTWALIQRTSGKQSRWKYFSMDVDHVF